MSYGLGSYPLYRYSAAFGECFKIIEGVAVGRSIGAKIIGNITVLNSICKSDGYRAPQIHSKVIYRGLQNICNFRLP